MDPDPTGAPADLTAGAGDGPVWGVASDDLNVTLLSWAPGTALPEHVNDELDVLLVVVSGSGTCTVDGREEPLAAARARLVPKGARRAIAAGPQGIRYLSIHRRRGPLQIA
jgi:mannose-6-phosphate isomerase-like protein (cupin superfamily)